MPAFNRRGPMGEGPMTGRRMGRCTNYGSQMERDTETSRNTRSEDISGNEPRRFGFGSGIGRRGNGMGRGRQNRLRGGF